MTENTSFIANSSRCIYCNSDKELSEFTLEHVIPQFLGGAQVPDRFKTRSVCKACNSNLGLFVDASFEKDFLVFNELNEAAYSFFDPDNPTGLPLRNMGISDLTPPEMTEDEVCESWIGPLGEQIYWIRPSDSRMYWYAGGNPRTVKKVKTKAYFLWAERSKKAPIITWLSFAHAFCGRAVKKITCTEILGANIADIGFSAPDSLDLRRIAYFNGMCMDGQQRKNNFSLYVLYDMRFMAKLAIGLGNILFGSNFNDFDYTQELHKALWFQEGGEEPRIVWKGNLWDQDDLTKSQFGVLNGVTVLIIPSGDYVTINLNISRKMNWAIGVAKISDVKESMSDEIRLGLCIVLYKSIGKCIVLSLQDLIAHNNGSVRNNDISQIEDKIGKHKNFFSTL